MPRNRLTRHRFSIPIPNHEVFLSQFLSQERIRKRHQRTDSRGVRNTDFVCVVVFLFPCLVLVCFPVFTVLLWYLCFCFSPCPVKFPSCVITAPFPNVFQLFLVACPVFGIQACVFPLFLGSLWFVVSCVLCVTCVTGLTFPDSKQSLKLYQHSVVNIKSLNQHLNSDVDSTSFCTIF